MPGRNDWIVAGINNPGWSTQDFATIADMNTDNTQLLSRDEYLKSDFIKQQDMFKDETGKFSERVFTDYYNQRVRDFGELQDTDFYRGPAMSMFDIFATQDTPIRETNFSIHRGVNPDRQAIGIEGVNIWSDPVFSQREIAKQNKVFNYETGEFEDYTVNDHALVKNPVAWVKDLFGSRDPLVMAAWDEDGTHIDPMTGMTRQHKKGELKMNDKGTYYYETLGDRSVLGKDVLSVFDTFTVDGEGINKYDFFDSNDIKKSVGGTIAKNIAAILPMFMGPVGMVYSGMMIARELAKSMPMLYGMITAFDETETPGWLNTLAAYGEMFSTSTSDWAKTHMWAAENMGNMIADVALQWGQQQLIAQGLGKLRGTNKLLKEAQMAMDAERAAKGARYVTAVDKAAFENALVNKYLVPAQEMASKAGQMGRDMSLVYMAIVSNTDVYQDMLDHGATKKEAAAVALGSSIGMFAVDKWLGLGELFFDDATGDVTKQARQALKNEFKQTDDIFKINISAETPVTNKFLGIFKRASEKTQRVMSQFREDLKYHTTNMAGKMIGEGLEEVSEEVVADAMKSFYELAGDFGWDTSVQDVGAWDNAVERYLMNFIGGVAGGGIFYGKSVWDNHSFHRPDVDLEIANLIRNGHASELRSQLDNMYNEGKTGSKSLSSLDYDIVDGGKIVWKTTSNPERTQGQVVRDLIHQRINAIEEVLVTNNVNMSDDELFDNMVLTEKRYLRYKEIAALTNYYNDFNSKLEKLINAEIDLRLAEGSPSGNPSDAGTGTDSDFRHVPKGVEAEREKTIAPYRKALEDAQNDMNLFLSGATSLDYTRKLNFLMDDELHEAFMGITPESHYEKKYGRSLDSVSQEEQVRYMIEEWPKYINEQMKDNITESWGKFKKFEAEFKPVLNNIASMAPARKRWAMRVERLFGEKGALSGAGLDNERISWNQKLDDETDEEFQTRDVKLMNEDTGVVESDADFLERRRNRWIKIDNINEARDKQYVDNVMQILKEADNSVDPQTLRLIKNAIFEQGRVRTEDGKDIIVDNGRLRAIITRKLRRHRFNPAVQGALESLNPDLSNRAEVIAAIRQAIIADARSTVEQVLNTILSVGDKDHNVTWSQMVPKLGDDKKPVKDPVTGETVYELKTLTGHLYEFLASADYLDQANVKDMLRLLAEADDVNFDTEKFVKISPDQELTAEQEDHNAEVDAVERLRSLDEKSRNQLLNAMIACDQRWVSTVIDTAKDGSFVEFKTLKNSKGDVITFADELTVKEVADGTASVGSYDTFVNAIVAENYLDINGEVTNFFKEVGDNPFFQLQTTLNTSVVNPIAEAIKQMAKANGDEVPDVEKTLNIIVDRFSGLEDASELILNSAEEESLQKVLGYLRLLNAYVYAASTIPNASFPFGHNRTANAFAASHSDKFLDNWEVLPEISSDYAKLLQNSIAKYISEIEYWQNVSRANNANRNKKIANTDKALNNVLWKVINSIKKEFRLNGNTYNLLNGIDKIDTSPLSTPAAQIVVYQASRLLNQNIAKIAAENKMSVSQLFQTTNILSENLVPDVGKAVGQTMALIDSDLKPEEFGAYDRLIYMATIVSRNPDEFFTHLNQRVSQKEDFIPVATQELAAQVVYAATTPTFKDIMAVGYGLMGKEADGPIATLLRNTVIVPGGAGVGKTSVIAQFIAELFRDKQIYAVAPHGNQATKLASTMGTKDSFTIEDLMEKILGKDLKKKIDAEMMSAVFAENTQTFDGTYIHATAGADGLMKVSLKPGAIKFNKLSEKPSLFVVDEATHMHTVYALILDQYCSEFGSQSVLCGDMVQLGKSLNTKAPESNPNASTFVMKNIDEGAVFAARTPNLTLSFRDDNIQKSNNQNLVRSIAEDLRRVRLLGTAQDYKSYMATAIATLKKVKFQVYRDDAEINGDLLVTDLDKQLLDILKAASTASDMKVGFVGDGNSTYLNKLTAAGVKVEKVDIHTLGTVQGQEYTYVVVDHTFTEPSLTQTEHTLQAVSELYTLMSRAEKATIFVENNIKSLIGGQELSTVKAKAPSIKSGIDELRGQKINVLDAIMKSIPKKTETKTPEKKPEKPKPKEPKTPPTPPAPETPSTPTTEGTAGETPEVESAVEEKAEEPVGELTVEGTETPAEEIAETPAASPEEQTPSDTAEEVVTPTTVAAGDESGKLPPAKEASPDELFKTPGEGPDGEIEETFVATVQNESETIDYGDGEMPTTETDENGAPKYTGVWAFPVECYSNWYYLDVSVDDKITTVAGKTRRGSGHVWTVQHPTDGPLRNLQALYDHGQSFFWYSDKMEAQRRLAQVRSLIIFNHDFTNEAVEGHDLFEGTWFYDRFDREDFLKEGHFDIEFRPVTGKEQLPLHCPEQKVGFEARVGESIIVELVYTTVDRWGRTVKFDLGSMNNPDTLADDALRAKLKENLQKRIVNMVDGERKNKLQEMVDTVDDASKQYSSWFNNFYNKYREDILGGNIVSINVDGAISRNMCTWLRSCPDIRLGGQINPNAVDANDINDLIDQNPDCVFSPIYTYSGNESDFYNFDPSLKGRAFILVSSDALTRPADMLTQYLSQKANPTESDPTIRCILLDNYGMSWSDLIKQSFANAFQGGNLEDFQFKMNFTGARMFTAMWNWRAALVRFNRAVQEWQNSHGWSDEQVLAVTKAHDVWFQNGRKMDQNVLSELNAPGIGLATTLEEAEALVNELIRFNNEADNGLLEVPMFRLGYTRKVGKEYHIQEFDVSKSSQYPTKDPNLKGINAQEQAGKANLCVISQSMALKFEQMLDTLIYPIVGDEKAENVPSDENVAQLVSLNTKFSKCSADGTVIGEFARDEFIDPYTDDNYRPTGDTKGGHRRSVSGLISVDGAYMKVVNADGSPILVSKSDGWSVIPRVLSKMCRSVLKEQREANGITETSLEYSIFQNVNGKSTESKRKLLLSFTDLFKPENRVLNESTVSPDNNEDVIIDPAFMDMFDLMFHGTTENIHRPVGDGQVNPETGEQNPGPLMQMTDAYFPQGFFINPDITRKAKHASSDDIVGLRGQKGNIIFFEISTHAGLLSSDVRPRISGIGVSLGALATALNNGAVSINGLQQARQTSQTVEEQTGAEYVSSHPVEGAMIQTLNTLSQFRGDLDLSTYSLNSIGARSAAETWHRMQALMLLTLNALLDDAEMEDVLNSPFVVKNSDGSYTVTTFGNYLAQTFPNYSDLDFEEKGLSFKTAEGRTIQVLEGADGNVVFSDGSVFSEKVSAEDGRTVGQALQEWLDSEEFEAIEPFAGSTTDEQANFPAVKEQFAKIVTSAIEAGGFTADQIDALNQVGAFCPISDALAEANERLRKILFINCKIAI